MVLPHRLGTGVVHRPAHCPGLSRLQDILEVTSHQVLSVGASGDASVLSFAHLG